MLKKLSYILLTGLLLFIITGCDLGVETNGNQDGETNEVTAIEDLENIEHFRDSALAHILEGELNRKGQAVGFHYDQLPTKNGEIIEGTETDENEQGVYEAKVIIDDVEKNANGGKSTFFPDDWDTQDVIDAINEAYDAKSFINGNTYEGIADDGVVVRMYLDNNDQIISAFPIY